MGPELGFVYLLYSVLLVSMTLALFSAYMQSGRRRYVAYWVKFSLFFALATSVNAVPQVQEFPLLIIGSYLGYGVSFRSLLLGMLEYTRGPVSGSYRKHLWFATGGWVFVMFLLTVVFESFQMRFLLFNLTASGVFGVISYSLERSGRKEGSRPEFLSLISSILVSFGWLARGIVALWVGTTSTAIADLTNTLATAGVSFGMILFSTSLFSLAQRRMIDQLQDVKSSIDSQLTQTWTTNLVSALSHELGTPLGSAITVWSTVEDHLSDLPVPVELKEALHTVRNELTQAVQRITSLRNIIGAESKNEQSAQITTLPEIAKHIAMTLDFAGVTAKVDDAQGCIDFEFRAQLSKIAQSVLELIAVLYRNGWNKREQELSLRCETQGEEGVMSIEPLIIPKEFLRDVLMPLQRAQVRGFTDCLIFSSVIRRLEHELSVKVQFRDPSETSGLELRFSPTSKQDGH